MGPNCAFGTIQASIALLVCCCRWCIHSRAFAANPDLETVLTGSRQRIETDGPITSGFARRG